MSSEGPLPYFDYYLKTLEDSYILYFQERIRVEETYVDSLRRLQLKHGALDSYRDDRLDRGTSLRRAWREVADNTDREMQTRRAFLENLANEVLQPLLILKETQERTRKRIKEDLKLSTETHVEYSENVLPRLKRNYLKRCQDAEEHKAEKASSGFDHADSSLTKVNSGPQIGSPMPMKPLSRHPSLHQPNRARSPSSSTAFSDLAHQGKRQFDSMISFLNTNGSKSIVVKDMLSRPEQAVKNVRAKREAEEAEKEYRKGVYSLETLRLRRVKILESGYKSLETFALESGNTMKKVLTIYSDSLMATSSTILQLTNHIEGVIKAISPVEDTRILTVKLRKMFISEIPKPVLYYNYMVGECKDLIFGLALVDYATSHNLPEGAVPRIVELCVKEIEARGIDTEGIYRISGRVTNVQELKSRVERDERSFRFNALVDDVACVASLLKLYFRELPEPVFRFPLAERIQHSADREGNISNDFPLIRSKLRRLPPIHQATLRYILEHLARVSSRSPSNKMDARNLAIVFNGVIFGDDDLPKPGDILSIQNIKDTLMEDLVTHASLLFEDRPTTASTEPPLPPSPSEAPKPKYDYGSSYTRTHTLPPRAQDVQDFAPTLPPRPGQSIHPSHRANALTSHPEVSYSVARPADPQPKGTIDASTPLSSVAEDIVEESQEVLATQDAQKSKADNIQIESLAQSPRTPDTFTTAASSMSRSSSPTVETTLKPSPRSSLAPDSEGPPGTDS